MTTPSSAGIGLKPAGRERNRIRRLAAPALRTIAQLAALGLAAVAAVAVIVAALGRPPSGDQWSWLAASVLAAVGASLFYPYLHRWLIDGASRLTSRYQQIPNDVVGVFRLRQSQAVPFEDVLVEVAEALQSSLGLRAAEWWSGVSGCYERVASAPPQRFRRITLSPAQERVLARMELVGQEWLSVWLADLATERQGGVVLAAPITRAGELVGFLVIERTSSRPFDEAFEATARSLLPELCRDVGPLLQNARLDLALRDSLGQLQQQAAALEASRARVVQAADAERQRIERNLHDGLQQQLVAVTLSLRLARELSVSDPRQASEIMERLEDDLERALEELRALAHGVYPPTLRDRGLLPVLSAAARRAPLPTGVSVAVTQRYAPEVEATIYFCCLEAINNACKHAGPDASVSVRVWEQANGVLFEIKDDGRGFASRQQHGVGLLNLEDRVGALGGSITIESAPGNGTRILGTVPLPRSPPTRMLRATEATGRQAPP